MYFVYILKSVDFSEKKYIGCTSNLRQRVSDHNRGTTAHTIKYKPWKLVLCIGFENKAKALEFEKYLKSGSGRSFTEKRLL